MPLASKTLKSEDDVIDEANVFQVSQIERLLPVTTELLRRENMRDMVLSKVYDAVLRGWNESEPDSVLRQTE